MAIAPMPQYSAAGDFHDGVAQVRDGESKKLSAIDTTGKLVIPCEYNKISKFSNGVAIVSKDNGSGRMNTAGQEILPCKYDIEKDYKVLSLLEGNNEVSWIMYNRETQGYEFVHIVTDYAAPAQPVVPTQPVTPAATNVNGAPAALEATVLKDDQGGAYTYYKLRDLGTALGFKVDWSAEKGIFIETK